MIIDIAFKCYKIVVEKKARIRKRGPQARSAREYSIRIRIIFTATSFNSNIKRQLPI